jgi:hypothetical protein
MVKIDKIQKMDLNYPLFRFKKCLISKNIKFSQRVLLLTSCRQS